MSKNSTEANASKMSTSEDSCFAGKLRNEIETKIIDLRDGETILIKVPFTKVEATGRYGDATTRLVPRYNVNYMKRIIKETCYKQNLNYSVIAKYGTAWGAKPDKRIKGSVITELLFKKESINYQHAEVDIYAQLRAKGAPVPYADYALAKVCVKALRLAGQYCDVVVSDLFQFTQYIKMLTEEINRVNSLLGIADEASECKFKIRKPTPVFFGVVKLKDVVNSERHVFGVEGRLDIPMRIKVRVQRN